MGKVVYFIDPLNRSKVVHLESSARIEEILKDLKIEKHSLCVTINGVTPDECDLGYRIGEKDLVEIREMVHGNSASDKQTLATVIQIAALVAVSVFTMGAGTKAAILIASSLAAGALNKKAMDMLAARDTETPEVKTETNSYSITNSTNSARPLEPMPVPMGSHRYAPDIHTQAYRMIFDQDNVIGSMQPDSTSFYPGGSSANGPESVGSTWITMPRGYIVNNPSHYLPQYDIQVAIYPHTSATMTPELATSILQNIRQRFLDIGNPTLNSIDYGGGFFPLVIYHSDPTDPLYRRFNLFYLIARFYQIYPATFNPTTYSNELDGLYSGSDVGLHGDTWLAPTTAGGSKNALLVSSGSTNYFYPSTVVNSDTTGDVFIKLGTYLMALNNGNLSSAKTVSYLTELLTIKFGVTTVLKEGIPYTSQTFNFGIGDLNISERKIGAIELLSTNNKLANFSPINKSNWTIPDLFSFDPIHDYPVSFYQDILPIDSKSLYNADSPDTPISSSDMNQYNWSYFDGQYGMDMFSMTLSGRVYATNTTTGFETNTCTVEIQFKYSNQDFWIAMDDGLITVENNNTKKVNLRIVNNVIDFDMQDKYLQVRARKMSPDPVDNEESNTADVSFENICFFKSTAYSSVNNEFIKNAPMNLDGIFITALATDVAQTNQYSALVESKCWVYDFDTETWSWDYNRNPAFWFLYFARGGFLNLSSNGTYLPPYSPTIGWVNYPGHPNSTEVIFGGGYTDDKIDIDKIKYWAQFCEDNELYLDMVLTDDTSVADALERIANVGRASVTHYGGILSVAVEDPEQPPSGIFGMNNIIAGSFSVEYMVADPVRKVTGKYVDRVTWETTEVEQFVPYSDPENLKEVEISLEGVTEEQQAQRAVNILAARQFFQRRIYRWQSDAEGMLIRRGDLVYLSHDSTQYGFSGRPMRFLSENGDIVGIKTPSIIDDSIEYITVREPNGDLSTYHCHVVGQEILFDDVYPRSKAPFYLDINVENADSDFNQSIPEDFLFIAGHKETPGKLVRISEVTVNEQMIYEFTAVDEDPAMWAFEYDDVEDPESFGDSEVVIEVIDVQAKALGNGLVKIMWNMTTGDFVQIINKENDLPVEANGAYSFSGGQITVELTPGQKYTLEVRPFAVGTPYKSVSKELEVWSL